MSTTPLPQIAKPTALVWGLIGLLGLIWGGAFFLSRVAVVEIGPIWLVAFRVGLAALTVHLVLAATGRTILPYLGRWRDFLGMGLLNNALPFSLLFLGQTEMGAGLASILNATTPIWTVILAHLLTNDERLDPAKVGGIMLGFAGVVSLLAPALVAVTDVPAWAMLCVVGTAICYGLAGIYGKRFAGTPPTVTAAGQLTASTIVMVPVALIVSGAPSACGPADAGLSLCLVPAHVWLAVAALAVISTALAYILFFRILSLAGAVNVSLVTLLVPASAIVLGAVFLGERLGPSAWLGLSLIACGLIVLDGRLFAARADRVQ